MWILTLSSCNTKVFDNYIFCTFGGQVCPTQVFDIQVLDVQVVDAQIFATQIVDVQTFDLSDVPHGGNENVGWSHIFDPKHRYSTQRLRDIPGP